MSRESKQYYGDIGLLVAVILGVVGSGVGLMLPIKGDVSFGTGNWTSDALVGALVGFVVGLILGLLLFWLVASSTSEGSNRVSQGPQLVGEMCIFCAKRIGSIVDGYFCPECRQPTHKNCIRQPISEDAHCSYCGAEYPQQIH